MIKRATRLAGLIGIAAALAFAGGGVAQAKHGADDPPAHQHEHAKGHHHRGHHHHHHHGRGHDDGPNHS